MTDQKNSMLRAILLVAVMSMALIGYGVGDQAAAEGASGNGIVARVDAPLRAPAWVEDEGVVIALQEDGRRLVRLDTGESFDGTRDFPVTTSQELDGLWCSDPLRPLRGRTDGDRSRAREPRHRGRRG